jgi:hypothetical protein
VTEPVMHVTQGVAMDTRSTGEVVASLVVNTQALVAKEVELLGLELRRLVARKVTAVAVLLVGASAAVGVLLLAAATAAIALEEVFAARWMAWGAVTLAVALVAALLVASGARTLARGWTPRSGRRDTTSTGAWLRALGAELSGGTTDDPSAAATEAGR